MTDAKAEAFKIEGLGGKKLLSGTISISGSKNEALAFLAASVLFDGTVTFANVPRISDTTLLGELLETLGAKVSWEGNTVSIDASGINMSVLPRELSRKFRASVILTGPLLARFKNVVFPPPGGCLIGKRPIDVFLDGFKKMGAEISINEVEDAFHIDATNSGKVTAADIVFRIQSVTGTEALLLAAALAEGKTTLVNVALEPEVMHLAEFLVHSGVAIEGIGTPTLIVHGTNGKLLAPLAAPFAVSPDRIETGSYAILGALCARELRITDCNPSHLTIPLETLRQSGVPFSLSEHEITIGSDESNTHYRPLTIKTHEYPGFPTDLQQPFCILATQATGESVIEEMIFEGRLSYTDDLVQMGAQIDVAHPHKAIIHGPSKLSGRELYSPDLRAGLAYIVAALVAEGTSYIHNIHYIDRGYERVEEKLRAIGVSIERIML